MKTIGLIGGMSCQSSAEYYRIINEGVQARLGGHHNARSLMLSVDFDEIETLQHKGEWDRIGSLMQQAARQLEAGGTDCIVLCTNTVHKVAPAIEAAVGVPLLHIADATAASVRERGFQTVALLGTRFTMEGEFYRGRLEDRHGLTVRIPGEADRNEVHRVIIDELGAQGAQAVILGCTEIPLLIHPDDSSMPVFDTTRIHAECAVVFALKAAS